MPSAKFDELWNKLGTIKSGPSQEDQLNLYAYGKLVKGGEPEKGGVFSPVQKAKYNHWEKIKNTGITPEEAEQKYIELAEQLVAKHG